MRCLPTVPTVPQLERHTKSMRSLEMVAGKGPLGRCGSEASIGQCAPLGWQQCSLPSTKPLSAESPGGARAKRAAACTMKASRCQGVFRGVRGHSVGWARPTFSGGLVTPRLLRVAEGLVLWSAIESVIPIPRSWRSSSSCVLSKATLIWQDAGIFGLVDEHQGGRIVSPGRRSSLRQLNRNVMSRPRALQKLQTPQ